MRIRLYFNNQVTRITIKKKKFMLNNLLKNSRLNIEQLTGIKKEPQRMGKHLRIIFGSLLIIIIAQKNEFKSIVLMFLVLVA